MVPDADRARPTRSATGSCTASSPSSARSRIAIDPAAHDRLVALTSHLPHVLANVVVNQAGATRVEGHEPLANAGGSLRDMTRIAGANPRIWIDIFLDNADARPRGARRAPPPDRAGRGRARRGATPASSRAGSARRRSNRRRMLDVRLRRRRRAPARAACTSPDRPGVLAGITQALGAERINIEDFELEHISPERGGTLTLLVTRRGRGAPRGGAAREPGLRRRRRRRCSMKVEPAARIDGHIAVPGDKSISHRALLIGALARARRASRHWGRSGDTESTLGAVRALGVAGRRGGRRHARRPRRRAARPPRARRRRSTAATPARSRG